MDLLIKAVELIESHCSCEIGENYSFSKRSNRKKFRMCGKCFKIKAIEDFDFGTCQEIEQISNSLDFKNKIIWS